VSKLPWPTGDAKHDARVAELDAALEEAGVLAPVGEAKAPAKKKKKKK
jgi:hypothetical protein